MSAVGIPPFDPSAPRSRYLKLLEPVVRSSFGRRFGIDVAARVDPWLLRVSHGRVGAFVGAPTALLTTTGAKSGERRSAAVLYFNEGEDVILIASNFGRERHPAWYHNLKVHPEALMQRGGLSASYLASEVSDETERARLFVMADLLYKGYADYRERTAAVGREIPLLRLTPARPRS
jgi:deazaflavin-dependent oxidoreductase (nitroreductase family)